MWDALLVCTVTVIQPNYLVNRQFNLVGLFCGNNLYWHDQRSNSFSRSRIIKHVCRVSSRPILQDASNHARHLQFVRAICSC